MKNFACTVSWVLALLPALAVGQVPIPEPSQPAQSYSSEEKDWGVPPTATVKMAPYHAPTPTSLPGARVIRTQELKSLLEMNRRVLVIDVLNSATRESLPGAFWMPGAGDGRFFAAEKRRFAAALEKLTAGDKDRPLVFLCLNAECWLSYNASLHALEAGYNDVIWYRGGTDAWAAAGLERRTLERLGW